MRESGPSQNNHHKRAKVMKGELNGKAFIKRVCEIIHLALGPIFSVGLEQLTTHSESTYILNAIRYMMRGEAIFHRQP